MPRYIYRTFEMYGYQDVDAANEQDAIDGVAGDDDPGGWTIDGYDDPPTGAGLRVWSTDGKRPWEK
jgi:hypothetical protein